MSFDIVFCPVVDDEDAARDREAGMAILDPLVDERGDGWAHIRTSDGGADVYGLTDPDADLMFNHASGRAVWNVMFELARAAGFAVLPIGCGTCVVDEAHRDRLPAGMPEPIHLVTSGAELLSVVTSS